MSRACAINCPEDRVAIAALAERVYELEANPAHEWHRFRRTPAGAYTSRGMPLGGRFATIKGGSPCPRC